MSRLLMTLALTVVLTAVARGELVLHYTFDDDDRIGGVLLDSVGSANATVVGAVGLGVDGVLGEAVAFPNDDGASYVQLSAGQNPAPNGAAPRTIAFWFNQLEVGVENKLFGYGTSAVGRSFDVSLEAGGVRLRYSGGNVTWGSGLYDFVGADAGFHHLAIRVNNGAADYLDIDVLLDGQLLTGVATGGTPASTPINTGGGSATALNLGRSSVFAPSGDFIGLMDDFRIYNAAISNAEIVDLADALERLVFHVDAVSGAVSLRNPTDAPIELDYYEIASSAGSLDAGGWVSLATQDREGFPSGNTGEPGWEILGVGSENLLAEGRLEGASILAPGASLPLGVPYDPSKTRDLAVTYRSGGTFRSAGRGDVEAGIAGDFNADGRVDAADYTMWRDAEGSSIVLPNDPTPHTIDASDRALWAASYGLGVGQALAAPEPTALSALVIGALSLAGWRRRSASRLGSPAVTSTVVKN
jgi:hypothetical protein